MDTLIQVVAPVFWGLVVLSVLVFVHEGGHFLAARACGVRVLEFFLGMPCRFNIHHVSKRMGTSFGVTPLLLGGYAEICGMDPTKVACAPQVLACIHRHGVIGLEEIASELSLEVDQVKEACITLYGWGSIVPREGVCPDREDSFPSAFAAPARDARGNTVFDGRAFDRASATSEGEAWVPTIGENEFYAQERAHTYTGVGFWKRAFMLVAGIAVNILVGFLLVIGVYSIIGVDVPLDANVVGSVLEDSPAQDGGLVQGDRIVSINGQSVDSWTSVLEQIDAVGPQGVMHLEVWRPHNADEALDHLPFDESEDSIRWASEHGTMITVDVQLDDDGKLGISVPMRTERLDPVQSCSIAIDNILATAQSVGSLLNPKHAMEVLDNSTSIVGISVMSAEAAAAGPATFLNFAALISFSLGFMNLLPIPPLDGGKLVIEVIQALIKREVPVKVQNAISIVGIVLFGLLFIYMLRSDILRFFL